MNRVKEEYKEKIIEMVNKCDNLHWLKVIYVYVKGLLAYEIVRIISVISKYVNQICVLRVCYR